DGDAVLRETGRDSSRVRGPWRAIRPESPSRRSGAMVFPRDEPPPVESSCPCPLSLRSSHRGIEDASVGEVAPEQASAVYCEESDAKRSACRQANAGKLPRGTWM